MGVYFLDSSAVVKRYLAEVGSNWVNDLIDPANGNQIHVSGTTEIEVTAAIVRGGRGGRLPPPLVARTLATVRNEFAKLYYVGALSAPTLNLARDLVRAHGLRGYDGIQLASAVVVHAAASGVPLILVSADVKLNTAATALGLQVDDPHNHP